MQVGVDVHDAQYVLCCVLLQADIPSMDDPVAKVRRMRSRCTLTRQVYLGVNCQLMHEHLGRIVTQPLHCKACASLAL